MTDQRNLPQERKALDPVDEALLNVWLNGGGALARAAKEILFSRFWLERMERDVWAGDKLVSKALKSYQTMTGLLGEVHQTLQDMLNNYDPATQGGPEIHPDEVQELINKIETTFKATLKQDEG
jgi:hypothetical protein